MFAVPQEIKVISVTKLNRFAKQVLESEIGQVWVSGEISNFTRAASGHWYFTLKDDKAQVRTAMFRGANQSVGFTPKHGDKVVVRANISLYEARGDYQLIAINMEPEGVGKLKQAFEKLKMTLHNEGLFAQEHKQTLPENIRTIGVVSSPTGAAIHDILHVLGRRNPSVEVVIYPSIVQGDSAASNICQQIKVANRRQEVDVLIVGRGGGSLEDLWPFNEEIVARAISESALPIVSAVGHEVDVTIADFVADIRAATPSAAAELLSEDKQVLQQYLNNNKRKLSAAMLNIIRLRQHKTTEYLQRLLVQHPQKKLENKQQDFDYLYARLLQRHPAKQIQTSKQAMLSLITRLNAKHPQTQIEQLTLLQQNAFKKLQQINKQQLQTAKQTQVSLEKALAYLSPAKKINEAQLHFSNQMEQLSRLMTQIISQKQQTLANNGALLNTVSPLATLSRGYSITRQDQTLIKSVNDVNENQKITSTLADGEIHSKIISIKKTNT